MVSRLCNVAASVSVETAISFCVLSLVARFLLVLLSMEYPLMLNLVRPTPSLVLQLVDMCCASLDLATATLKRPTFRCVLRFVSHL